MTTPTVQARRPDQLLSVPPIIAELMADEPALVTHLQIAERYKEAVVKATELARSLEQVRRQDDARRRDSLASGKKPAKAQAPDVEAELAQTKRDVELLAGAVRDSMTTLATAAVAFIDKAAAELERRRQASIERLRDLIRAAESAITEHGALGGEAGWVASLRLSGRVQGYRPGTHAQALRRTAEAVRRLALDLDEDLRRQGEIAEARQREEAVELPLPPGARIWGPPGASDKVVTEAGKVEEVER